MIENEVDRLDVLYGFGVRQMGIAYSEANMLGAGLKERGDGGLTYFGERAVAPDEQARHRHRHLALAATAPASTSSRRRPSRSSSRTPARARSGRPTG